MLTQQCFSLPLGEWGGGGGGGANIRQSDLPATCTKVVLPVPSPSGAYPEFFESLLGTKGVLSQSSDPLPAAL